MLNKRLVQLKERMQLLLETPKVDIKIALLHVLIAADLQIVIIFKRAGS